MDAASLHRRLYRLALLLTGRPERAAMHAGAVAGGAIRPRLVALGTGRGSAIDLDPDAADRLERQVLLACRRDAAAGPAVAPGFGRLAGLPTQFREAFVLVRVLGRSLREAARAMDCSRTAVRRHLDRADAALVAAAATAADAAAPNPAAVPPADLGSIVAELRRDLQAAPDAPPWTLVAGRRARSRCVRVLVALLAAGAVGFAAWRGWAAWSASTNPAPPAELERP